MGTGVRQGCLLSPMIFIMVVAWIMKEMEDQGKTGIQWTLTTQPHDLNYTDDICLLSQKLQHMQTKTNNLERIAEKTGLRISKDKTKVMRANTKQQDKIKLKVRIWKMSKASLIWVASSQNPEELKKT